MFTRPGKPVGQKRWWSWWWLLLLYYYWVLDDDHHHQRVIPSNSPQSLNHHPHGPHGSIKMVHVHTSQAKLSSATLVSPAWRQHHLACLHGFSDFPSLRWNGKSWEIPHRNAFSPVAGKIIRWRWKNGTTQIYWENHQMEVEKWDCLQMGSHGKFI